MIYHEHVWHYIELFMAGWELERIPLHPPGQLLEGVHLWTLRRITQKEEQNGGGTQDHPGSEVSCWEIRFCSSSEVKDDSWGMDIVSIFYFSTRFYHSLSSAFYLILPWRKDQMGPLVPCFGPACFGFRFQRIRRVRSGKEGSRVGVIFSTTMMELPKTRL